MFAQLSTSRIIKQLIVANRAIVFGAVLCLLGAPSTAQVSSWSRPTEVEQRVEPLSPLDHNFMANQRAEIESLANQLGRRLTGDPERDIDTLQALLDSGLVANDDTLTLQAMGVVLGDLLAKTLTMDWVVYRDRAGRSKALRYRQLDVYLYPVTMISRRREAGNTRAVKDIYQTTVAKTRPKLPGAKWR